MGMVELALIGKLKKTKADKTNVLQLNNTTPFIPSQNYHPTTKKYVDDSIAAISGGGSGASMMQYFSQSTMPETIKAGDIWFNTENGETYIFHRDYNGITFFVALAPSTTNNNNAVNLQESETIVVTNLSSQTYVYEYATNFIQVFVNRLKLRKSEFTAVDGETITINIPLELGDEIEFITVEG